MDNPWSPSVFASSLPDHVPGASVNRQCGSSLTAIQICHAMIASGTVDIAIASGCEAMSKYPIGCDVGGTLPDGRPQGIPYGPFYFERVKGKFYNQAQAAQAIGEKWGITKEMCDEFAVTSHTRAGSPGRRHRRARRSRCRGCRSRWDHRAGLPGRPG